MIELAADQYFKNSEKIVLKYNNVFSGIPSYDKVVIMGLSCGTQDAIYVREILRYAKVVDFYYHDAQSKSKFESFTAGCCVDVDYIYW